MSYPVLHGPCKPIPPLLSQFVQQGGQDAYSPVQEGAHVAPYFIVDPEVGPFIDHTPEDLFGPSSLDVPYNCQSMSATPGPRPGSSSYYTGRTVRSADMRSELLESIVQEVSELKELAAMRTHHHHTDSLPVQTNARETGIAKLHILVGKASNLSHSPSFTPDPYVKLQIGDKSIKTSTKKSTANPLWNESFKFFVRLAATTHPGIRIAAQRLELKMMDANRDEELGAASVNLQDLIDSRPCEKTTVLKDGTGAPVGRLTLVVKPHGFGLKSVPRPPPAPPVALPSDYLEDTSYQNKVEHMQAELRSMQRDNQRLEHRVRP
eukprot:NODE_2835_length_1081_cov_104.992662_g2704_i0.p1 GENE.NODE_2835_length_1081_cov_104.992662_g2704_i0~~NODE_2835_length_1081_cov_104.992662_g2704_i0.p1  ORF type:complete len:321 (-),score=78.50 NODE_2835_length_1081_cov_104.992662_g2704_i0:62-1024(-)